MYLQEYHRNHSDWDDKNCDVKIRVAYEVEVHFVASHNLISALRTSNKIVLFAEKELPFLMIEMRMLMNRPVPSDDKNLISRIAH